MKRPQFYLNRSKFIYPNTLYHKETSTNPMTIHLAEHYGICFGVRDALALAERIAADEPLTILGQLVHNPIARERLEALGVRQGALDDHSGRRNSPRDDHRARQLRRRARARWRDAGHAVADATCPLVRHAHGQLRRLVEDEGCFPVIIGKHGHVEVLGLAGDFPEAVVLETEADLAAIPDRPLYGVVSQTTQPIRASAQAGGGAACLPPQFPGPLPRHRLPPHEGAPGIACGN